MSGISLLLRVLMESSGAKGSDVDAVSNMVDGWGFEYLKPFLRDELKALAPAVGFKVFEVEEGSSEREEFLFWLTRKVANKPDVSVIVDWNEDGEEAFAYFYLNGKNLFPESLPRAKFVAGLKSLAAAYYREKVAGENDSGKRVWLMDSFVGTQGVRSLCRDTAKEWVRDVIRPNVEKLSKRVAQ